MNNIYTLLQYVLSTEIDINASLRKFADEL